MDKQQHRNARRKKQKHQSKQHFRKDDTNIKSLPPIKAHADAIDDNNSDEDDEDPYDIFDFVRGNLKQPESRFADNPEEGITSINDFEDLANATVSSGYFQFKSEKNWTVDTSKYSQLLAIDVKKLATICNCISFNQLIEVDDKYFTNDQLTYITSKAEHAEKIYEEELLDRKKNIQVTEKSKNDKSEENNCEIDKSSAVDKEDDDLDFLLSLKTPTAPNPVNTSFLSKKTNEESKRGGSDSAENNSKPVDLEKWLDSVLDL